MKSVRRMLVPFPLTSFVLSTFFLTTSFFTSTSFGDDPVFSGPQVGERAVPFEARTVFGDDGGKTIQVAEGDSPTLVVFVHEVTRQSVGLARLIVGYATQEKLTKAGLKANLIFLTNDRPSTENWMKLARHALPAGVSPLVSIDGIEGPGAYGLNRHVQLTILVANEGKVTDNFALVQPSIQVDAPKIGAAIAKVCGEKEAPTLKDMGFEAPRMARMAAKDELTSEQNAKYRELIAPVIRAESEETVEKAAKAVEEYAAKHEWFKNKVKSASTLIVGGGKLDSYGRHEKARDYLRKWAGKKER